MKGGGWILGTLTYPVCDSDAVGSGRDEERVLAAGGGLERVRHGEAIAAKKKLAWCKDRVRDAFGLGHQGP